MCKPVPLLLLLLCLVLKSQTGQAQILQQFTLGNAATDEQALAVKQQANGYIYLAGNNSAGPYGGSDLSLSKLTPAGDSVLWTNHYGGPSNDFCIYMNTAGPDGIIMVGASYTGPGGAIPDALLIKADTAGNEIFKKIIGQPATAESFSFVEQTADNGFIACGFTGNTFPFGQGNDAVVIKFDSLGNIQWQQILGGAENDYAQEVRQLPDGTYIVAVDSRSFNPYGFYDCIAYKLDAAGSEEWSTIAGGDPFDTGNQGITITAAGDYIMFGEAATGTSPGYDITISKVHRNGQLLWNRTWPQIGTEAAFSALELSNGNILLAGYSNGHTSGTQPTDIFLIEADSAGLPLTYTYIGGPGADIAYDVQASAFGGHLIAGAIQIGGSFDYALLRYNYTGPLQQAELLPLQTHQLLVFPNPVVLGAPVYVSLPAESSTLRLTDALGHICWSYQSTAGGQFAVQFPATLPPGIYVLQAEGAQWQAVQKVVVR